MSSSASDHESDAECSTISRLGNCEVCGANEAKYTCPKCEVKTCCLNCVVIHKKELECDGIRDRTKFIRKKDFSDTDLLSDYRLLEECARFVYGVKRDEKKRFTRLDKDLPIHLYKLKMAARKRGTALQFLAQNFTRHKENTTRYHYRSNTIMWRVDWCFINAEPSPVKFVDQKCPEHTKLSDLLDKYLNVDAEPFEGSKALTYYRAAGFSGVKVLMKAEKISGSHSKYLELDPEESLADNLAGKCVVEYPIIVVALTSHAYNLDVVQLEDEFEIKDTTAPSKTQRDNDTEVTVNDTDQHTMEHNMEAHRYLNSKLERRRKRPRELLTEKVAKEKQQEIEKELKEERKKRPKNLLFTTGYSSDEDVRLSDDGDETLSK